ncbi:MAG: ribbon-helix-helix domain-containing protein [Candidatus Lokiarchaeota archaeon]|nr:ribbon-helix-helix domain-containing protein [Candidatus Harpocratesius repetitus]
MKEIQEDKKIRIVTCNVPITYLTAIDKLITSGNHQGLYPSRSELIRIAVREFLLKELEAAKEFEKLKFQSRNKDEIITESKEINQPAILKKIKTP